MSKVKTAKVDANNVALARQCSFGSKLQCRIKDAKEGVDLNE